MAVNSSEVKTEARTRGLGQAVRIQAAWLNKMFEGNVEIQFSADGNHGTAFILDKGEVVLGFAAGLVNEASKARRLRALFRRGRRIYHAVRICVSYLKPRQRKYVGHGVRGQYAFFYCNTAKEARSVLIRKLRPERQPAAYR